MNRRWLVAVLACTACGRDPGPPPPPSAAVASCAYTRTIGDAVETNTLWFDAADHVIRVDGWWAGDTDVVPAYYEISYDDAGRIVEQHSAFSTSHYVYSADQIVETGDGHTWITTLVGGRASHFEGPMESAVGDRTTVDYRYDAGGRVLATDGWSFYDVGQGTMKYHFGLHYTYAAEGRVTAVVDDQLGPDPTTLAYTETASQLAITIGDGSRWTYDFDASHRIAQISVDGDGDGTPDEVDQLAYAANEITETVTGYTPRTIRASGRCDAPSVVTAPTPPLPIRWPQSYDHLENAAARAFDAL